MEVDLLSWASVAQVYVSGGVVLLKLDVFVAILDKTIRAYLM